ncbi:MAG: AAA family ATPase [Chloroflexi bacterium]|nr:AAA family ATPase [Chloroflexota bacterium]
MTSAQTPAVFSASPTQGGLPPEPSVGLFGREAEVAALSAALGAERRSGPMLVHGYEGVGKTALVQHVARALGARGRFANVVYSRLSGGGRADLALHDLSARLGVRDGKPDDQNAEQRVAQSLRELPTLVIWDQVEALFPGAEGIASAEALLVLVELGTRLTAETASCVCLIADAVAVPEILRSTLPDDGLLAVGGLQEDAAVGLLEALAAANGAEWRDAADTRALVRGLGGHAMALVLLAAAATARTPAVLLRELEAIVPGFGAGEATQRNLALEVALEAWLRTLDEPDRLQVLALAPFVDGLMAPLGGSVKLDERADWKALLPRLVRAQIMHTVSVSGLAVEYAYLAPGLSLRLDRRLTEPQRALLTPSYCGAYLGLLGWMAKRELQSPRSMQWLLRCELPNLHKVAGLLLASDQLQEGLQFSGQLQGWLVRMGLPGAAARLAERAKAASDAALPPEGPLPRRGVRLLLSQAEQMNQAGQLAQALTVLSAMEKRVMAEQGLGYAGDDALVDRGLTLHALGRYLASANQHAEAAKRLAAAIEQFAQAKQTEGVRSEVANALGHLGEAYLASQQIDAADSAFERGLDLARELEDYRLMGLMQMGRSSVQGARGDEAQSESLLHSALEYLANAEQPAAMANAWQQLAVLALRRSDLEGADKALQQALQCAEQAQDGGLQAQMAMQLGRVAEASQRPADARALFERAARLSREQHRPLLALAAELALGNALLQSGDTQAAKEHAMEAGALVDKLGAQAKPWQAYDLLGRIAQAEDNAERREHWRLAAQESYAASAEGKALVGQWDRLTKAVVQACRGGSLAAEAVDALEELETNPTWGSLAGALWRILSGDREADVCAELELQQAAVARHVLDELQQE